MAGEGVGSTRNAPEPQILTTPQPQILFVCTGNRCRSPYMEVVFRELIGETGGPAIESAGTQAVDGEPIAGPMADILAVQGLDASRFRSRMLTAEMIAGATLVLTADREQGGQVCRLYPSALRRVFTLRQAARLLTDGGLGDRVDRTGPIADRMSRLVELMARERGMAGPARTDDEVVDPWEKSHDVYLRSVRTMYPALVSLAGVLSR